MAYKNDKVVLKKQVEVRLCTKELPFGQGQRTGNVGRRLSS